MKEVYNLKNDSRQIRDSKTEIIDIGPKGSQPTSVYYKIELNEIKKLKK